MRSTTSGMRAVFGRQLAHLGHHLLDALRRAHLVGTALEGRGGQHVAATFGQQRNDVAVEAVDLLAHLRQRFTVFGLSVSGHGH